MEPKFQVQTRIQKPVTEVFSAVQDNKKLSGYFTNGGASAPLVEGTTVEWTFADNPGGGAHVASDVIVKKVVPNERIELEWGGDNGAPTSVVMRFEGTDKGDTIVRISESGWKADQQGLDASYGNCMGWSQMLSALKAYVEYGIDLRKGAYEGLYDPDEMNAAKKGA